MPKAFVFINTVPEFMPQVLEEIRKGMYLVANGSSGTARSSFVGFPIKVGAKTGSAQKSGKIPPQDEIEYFKDNLSKFAAEVIVYRDLYNGYYGNSYEENLSNVTALANHLGIEPKQVTYEYIRDKVLTAENLEKETEEILLARSEELNGMDDEDHVKSLVYNGYLNTESAMREAIKKLVNYSITDTEINKYRDDYDAYAWFVSFAPFDDPEVAVVLMIPQGGSGGYGGPVVKDIYAEYFGLNDE